MYFFYIINNKVNIINYSNPNYYRIIIKDIGVQTSFEQLTFVIVNNIQLTINIKFINKFSTDSIGIKDLFKFFHQKVSTSSSSRKFEVIEPKKLKNEKKKNFKIKIKHKIMEKKKK